MLVSMRNCQAVLPGDGTPSSILTTHTQRLSFSASLPAFGFVTCFILVILTPVQCFFSHFNLHLPDG
jgi:hypothetical protein